MRLVCHVGRFSGLLLGYHHCMIDGLYCAYRLSTVPPSCFCTRSRLCCLLSPRSLPNNLILHWRLNRASTTPPKHHPRSRGTPTTFATHPTSTQHIMSSQISLPWVVESSSMSRSSPDTTRYVHVTSLLNVRGRWLPYRQKATCSGIITDPAPAHTGQPCPRRA